MREGVSTSVGEACGEAVAEASRDGVGVCVSAGVIGALAPVNIAVTTSKIQMLVVVRKRKGSGVRRLNLIVTTQFGGWALAPIIPHTDDNADPGSSK